MRGKRLLSDLATYGALVGFGLTMMLPLLWMLSTSLKEPQAAVTYPPEFIPRRQLRWRDPSTGRELLVYFAEIDGRTAKVARRRLLPGKAEVVVLWPREMAGRTVELPLTVERGGRRYPSLRPLKVLHFHWQNYPDAWHALKLERPWMAFDIGPWHFPGFRIRYAFLAFYLNSLIVTIIVTVGDVFTSSLAAFAFARLRFRGRNPIFLAYLATLMVPRVVTMIPVFILLRWAHLIDTYAALILPFIFSAYGTFMLRQFFLSIPPDLEDAAFIDGCSTWGVYRHVIIPLSKPALAALATFTFLGTWNAFMWPLIVINSPEKMTLMLGLYSFMGQYSVEWNLLMAASVLVMGPVIVVFLIGQRYFVQGILLSGVKG